MNVRIEGKTDAVVHGWSARVVCVHECGNVPNDIAAPYKVANKNRIINRYCRLTLE